MDVQDMLQQLETNTGTFPLEALAQAIAQREEIIPELLRALAEAQHNIEIMECAEFLRAMEKRTDIGHVMRDKSESFTEFTKQGIFNLADSSRFSFSPQAHLERDSELRRL